MLPDFPGLKKDCNKAMDTHLDTYRKQSSPMLREINEHRIFEGKTNSTSRPGETEQPREMRKASATLELSNSDVHAMTLQAIIKRHEAIVDEIVKQQIAYVLEVMHEATEKTGNVVDGKGKPLSPDLFLEILEKIEISFSGAGIPSMPSMVVHPSQEAHAKAVQEQIWEDPIHRRQYIEIMEKKRKDWFAREAGRVLVG